MTLTSALRRWTLGGLALVLAAAASAQVRVLPLEAVAPVGLPPLIVGTPSAPAPLLASSLSIQAAAIAALPVPAVSAYLAERAASAAPADRAAAKILAASVAGEIPAAAAVPAARREGAESDPGLRELAESARVDPALSSWFDGSAAAPSLGLDGLKMARGGWRRGEEKLDGLGRGDFGFVDVHPAVPGAVIKTVEHSAMNDLFGDADPSKNAANEEKAARALAAADAGPRHFGQDVVDGRLVSVRERVYGETLEDAGWERRLGPAESALVRDLLRRLAAAGLKPNDMRPANVMIGRTALDPRRRAYVVDSGGFAAFPAGLDEEGRYKFLLEDPITLWGRFDPNIGFVTTARPMSEILARGEDRAMRTTAWLKFKGVMREIGGLFWAR